MGGFRGGMEQLLVWSHACIQAGMELSHVSSYYLIKQNVLKRKLSVTLLPCKSIGSACGGGTWICLADQSRSLSIP